MQEKIVHIDDLPTDRNGRYGDEYTVHLNKPELQALTAPTNGYVTINPKTGKPEAFLQFLIPLLADALAPAVSSGLGSIGLGGLAGMLGNAGIGAALGGLGTWAATGDPLKGLMGGIGGWMGAGPTQNILGKMLGGSSSTAASAAAGLPGTLGAAQSASDGLFGAASQTGPAAAATSSVMGALKNPLLMGTLAMGLGSVLNNQKVSTAKPPVDPYTQAAIDQAQHPVPPPERYQYANTGNPLTYGYTGGEHKFFNYADGGMVGGYKKGGIVGVRMPMAMMGPGDGSSDSIPASIGGRKPAKLSQGEFVVPSDVVSHLGNGSTNAGSSRLQGMVHGVRMAKTGNPGMPQRI